ncbi:Biotinidase [Halotydeus destructor]|nr:Biotinidase [Halotydeus destructor]
MRLTSLSEMFTFLLILSSYTSTVLTSSSSNQSCFRAAVYDHIPYDSVQENLNSYVKAIEDASKEEANVIVFPEYGLIPYNISRSLVLQLAEQVPTIRSGSRLPNPCVNGYRDRKILYRISCAARLHRMYVIVTLVDVYPCDKELEICRDDGHSVYNVQVAFRHDGAIVAKYHKYHLFGEHEYDTPSQELVYFDTPFGRMGLFVGTDLLFKVPGVTLVRDHDVTTLLHSSKWKGEEPFLTARQMQQGFAVANDVNILSANVRDTTNRILASGIYSGLEGAVVYGTSDGQVSTLLIANLPVSRKVNNITACLPKPLVIEYKRKRRSEMYAEVEQTNIDDFAVRKLTSPRGELEVCISGSCCNLEYKVSDGSALESYRLVARNYIHLANWAAWCEQVCALVQYDEDTGEYRDNVTASFEVLKLEARFDEETVYPVVSSRSHRFEDFSNWRKHWSVDDNVHQLYFQDIVNVTRLGFYGRCYNRDPPYTRKWLIFDPTENFLQQYYQGQVITIMMLTIIALLLIAYAQLCKARMCRMTKSELNL